MYGISIEGGVNNCEWNVEGRCTNPEITKIILPPGFTRDWSSKQKCTLTIIGVHKCEKYEAQKEL